MLKHALLALILAPAAAQAADPSALWKIISQKCIPHEQTDRDPSPCSVVDLALGTDKGYVVLKDINGVAQFLLMPTARISGIEDPAILAPDATNYWDAAWKARYFVDERLHTALPRDAVALAINSASARSQDQLHIHIDCIRPDVRQTLQDNLDKVSTTWAPFAQPLAGHLYNAIRIDHESLDQTDPFRILAQTAPKEMGQHTLVLVGEPNGFILLDGHDDHAAGEQLQDHTCSVAAK